MKNTSLVHVDTEGVDAKLLEVAQAIQLYKQKMQDLQKEGDEYLESAANIGQNVGGAVSAFGGGGIESVGIGLAVGAVTAGVGWVSQQVKSWDFDRRRKKFAKSVLDDFQQVGFVLQSSGIALMQILDLDLA